MREPALKYLGGGCRFLFRRDLNIDKVDASFVSVSRLFHARIVAGKNESRKRLVMAL